MRELEGTENLTDSMIAPYLDPDSAAYSAMLEKIRSDLNFTTLRYHRLDDMIEAVGIPACRLCTYCWNGRE